MITTTIDWYDARATRPCTSGEYWCIVNGKVYSLTYSRLHNYFNVTDSFDEKMAFTLKLEPTHYANIPKEFKEVK